MKNNKHTIRHVIIYSLLILTSIFIVYPLLYAFFGSFKTTSEFLSGGINLLPKQWRYQNYIDALKIAKFSVYTANSIIFSVLSVVFVIITCSMAGYLLARAEFIGKKLMLGLFAASMFLTGATTIFPVFLLCKKLGLLNSLWGMVAVQVAWSQPMYAVLIMGYISGIPKSLDESAKLDGCSMFGIYARIILPIIKPIIATVALLQFREAWNSYMVPLAFTLSRPRLRTLAVGVVALKDSGGDGVSAWNLMIAGTVISIIPILIVYIFLNRYFISGITEGAVKG